MTTPVPRVRYQSVRAEPAAATTPVTPRPRASRRRRRRRRRARRAAPAAAARRATRAPRRRGRQPRCWRRSRRRSSPRRRRRFATACRRDGPSADRRCGGARRRRSASAARSCPSWRDRRRKARQPVREHRALLAWSSAMRTDQPPGGASPATATSPPSETSTPQPAASCAARAPRSAASAFAVAPRSSSTPGGTRTRRALLVELDALRGERLEARLEAVGVAMRDEPEVAVVAGEPQRAAERRRDDAVRRVRRAQRDAQRLEQKRADANGAAGGRVHARELAVVAEAAARGVDRSELVLDGRACGVESRGIDHDDDRGRPESRKRCGRAHEPPDTTTGGAGVGAGATGGGAGAGAGAGAGVGAATCLTCRTA